MRSYVVLPSQGDWILEERTSEGTIHAWSCPNIADVLAELEAALHRLQKPLYLTTGALQVACHRWLEGKGTWWVIFANGKIWGIQAPTQCGASNKLRQVKPDVTIDGIYAAN